MSEKTTAKALLHIITSLKWCSNIVTIDVSNTSSISSSKRCILSALSALEKMNLIKKTIANNRYVINHNEIFYGDKKQFIKEYNRLYEGKLAEVTKGGRIIL